MIVAMVSAGPRPSRRRAQAMLKINFYCCTVVYSSSMLWVCFRRKHHFHGFGLKNDK